MKIEGKYVFSAPAQLVWSLMYDPATICQTLPNCEKLEQVRPREYVLALQVDQGPFKGRYVGQILVVDSVLHERSSLLLEGEGPDGAMRGKVAIRLEEADDSTTVHYEVDLERMALSAGKSSRLLRTFANSLIRQYLEAIAKQVRIQTGIHTTQLAGEQTVVRRTGAVSLQDALAEARQDRQTIRVVLALLGFAFFTFTGVVVFVLLLFRLGKRMFDRRVAEAVRRHQSANGPSSSP